MINLSSKLRKTSFQQRHHHQQHTKLAAVAMAMATGDGIDNDHLATPEQNKHEEIQTIIIAATATTTMYLHQTDSISNLNYKKKANKYIYTEREKNCGAAV